jgi:Zn-dependent protease/predicted transcriptional regulator
MRWSVPIGRVFGITLRLHVTFIIFLAFIGYSGFVDEGWNGAMWAVALFSSIFACIALHELGHSVVAQELGVQVKSITLLPIGGVAALRNIPENPWHEIAITLAGPMVNAVIAAALLPFTGLPSRLFFVAIPQDVHGLLLNLAQANITLFLFNFIPAFPMDGGRLLRAVLALALSYRRATAIAATVGQGLAILFILAGLKFSFWLVIIGLFIFMGAEGEERIVRMRSFLHDLDVEEVMSRDFVTLTPHANIGEGLRMVYQTGQDDFPVMDGDRLVGLVSRAAMVATANNIGPQIAVAEVMDIDVPVVSPQNKVLRVYEEMMSEGRTSFPVVDGDRVVGLLGLENISRYLLVQSSLKPSGRSQARRLAVGRTPAPPPVISAVHPTGVPPPREGSGPPSGRA